MDFEEAFETFLFGALLLSVLFLVMGVLVFIGKL